MSNDLSKDFINNFPHPEIRDKQRTVLNEIAEAINSGYKTINLQAPTGFGKSAVAVAMARSLGSSYICTSTNNLQTQYVRDFPYIKSAIGANNFICRYKKDFDNMSNYRCGSCDDSGGLVNFNRCWHTDVAHGTCKTEETMKGNNCPYKPLLKDYIVNNLGQTDELIKINPNIIPEYISKYHDSLHFKELDENLTDETLKQHEFCNYYDQLNIALLASHSILNYKNFLIFLKRFDPKTKEPFLPDRELLVLDEGHLLETEIVNHIGVSISERTWKRYIFNFEIPYYDYEDKNQWIEFLIKLETAMIKTHGYRSIYVLQQNLDLSPLEMIESFATMRKEQYDWKSPTSSLSYKAKLIDKETIPDVEILIRNLHDNINDILRNKNNWVVANIKKDKNNEDNILKIEMKPLDISRYTSHVFNKCPVKLIMSATILDNETYCESVGLNPQNVKYIEVSSDFPINNRLIKFKGIERLTFHTIYKPEVQFNISKAVDSIMSTYKEDKGIIHTVSYDQLNFIKKNLSHENQNRLLETGPDIERNELIEKHIIGKEPTVLISPSFNLGLDLKYDLSRFQIMVKVPYLSSQDKWIVAKRNQNYKWYQLQAMQKLIQTCGRSVRAKDDWADTYILDKMFETFIYDNRNIVPQWFMDSIVWKENESMIKVK